MKARTTISISALCLKMFVLLGVMTGVAPAWAETIWSGPSTNFTQAGAPADMDVLVPGAIAIRRQPGSYLYNPAVDLGPGDGTPSGVEWAFGTMANHLTLQYKPFSQIRADGSLAGLHVGQYILNKDMVMHLINQNIYISVQFTNWPMFGGSTFTYNRSTPATVATPPTPSVTITNPASGATFAEPANVTIAANATVSTGTVTNVMFFQGSTFIGSNQAPPFKITADGLTNGSYALKAVATAAGVSGTSSVVNISVVTPVVTSLSAVPATFTNKQFVFSYSATPGLRYEVDASSNLLNWTPVVTNVAAGNTVFITNNALGDGNYYRVGRLPNP